MRSWLWALALLLIGSSLCAQDDYPFPSLSPLGTITQVVGNTQIEVSYERPAVRRRAIFGALVPWDQVWRTGAGHCTKLSFDRPVIVEGQSVPAGTYSLFTIPNPDEWMVMLNKDTTLYGSNRYDASQDVARFLVRPGSSARHYESLTIDLDVIPNNARLYISWDHTQVSFLIETTTDDQAATFIREELLTEKHQQSDGYTGAADYLYFQGLDYLMALDLADKALALDPDNGWAMGIKTTLYEKLQLYEQALDTITQTIEWTRRRDYGDQEIWRQRDIEQLEAHYQRILEKQ
ncbi:MAG: DUF2911 domain-containing protein [Lewinella sp.]|nr:DUF2911 domain-containing protein [Lewinella sp.]